MQKNNVDRFFTKDPSSFSRSYLDYLGQILKSLDVEQISKFIGEILKSREVGATIFFIGNGGSAATASHFANDIAFGTRELKNPFRVISLTDNVPVITAIGNDFGYEEIFRRQLSVLGKQGDLVVGISASGNSPNIINAFKYAQESGIKTIAITAFDGGAMKSMADLSVHVPTDKKEYGPAEDVHMILDHLVGAYLMRFIHLP
jgi:D-sedoheptulose 7-phosphate isomerase